MKHSLRALLIALLLWTTAITWAQDNTSIRLGLLIAPQEWIGTPAYDAIQHGAELAAEAINNDGGIIADNGNTYRVRLLTREAGDAEAVTNALTAFATEGVTAVIGPAYNAHIPAAVTIEYPLLTTASGADGSFAQSSSYLFQLRANDASLAQIAARYAIDELASEELGVVVARADYGYAAQDAIYQAVAGDETVAITVNLDRDLEDTAAARLADEIATEAPDTLIVWDTPSASAALLSALAEAGWQGAVLLGYADADIAAVDGIDVYSLTHWLPDADDNASEDFVQDYQERYGTLPTPVSALYYDAVMLLSAGVADVGTAGADLQRWLAQDAEVAGLQGTYRASSESGELLQEALVMRWDGAGWQEETRLTLGESSSDTRTTNTVDEDEPASADAVAVTSGENTLNLRAAPNANGSIVGVIPAATALTAFARNTDDNQQTWLAITYNGQEGWIIRDGVTVNNGNPDELPESSETFSETS
jgi:branched-chain amino acid transport system substrate-binding protein